MKAMQKSKAIRLDVEDKKQDEDVFSVLHKRPSSRRASSTNAEKEQIGKDYKTVMAAISENSNEHSSSLSDKQDPLKSHSKNASDLESILNSEERKLMESIDSSKE